MQVIGKIVDELHASVFGLMEKLVKKGLVKTKGESGEVIKLVDYVLQLAGKEELPPTVAEYLVTTLLELSKNGDLNVKMMFADEYIVKFITTLLDIHN